MLEDCSLRYAPKSYRTWSESVVATAALGGIAYLADFAIGASIAITDGFTNALVAVLAKNSRRWWSAVVAAGPGWVILGAFEQFGGAFLAFYVAAEVGLTLASEPIEQFIGGFDSFLPIGIVLGLAGR